MALIEFRNIFLKFNQRILFEDFNLKIEKGDKILLSAPSGRGKTTLVKMLLGFIVADSGEILVDEVKLSGKTVNKIRGQIAYVSQDADIPKGKISEVFLEIFHFHQNRDLEYNQKMLETWLPEFSLPLDTVNKQLDDLSGGERQRLAIILGLLLKRDIWILDEITTGLDLELKKKIVDLLFKNEKTMLIISHDEIFKNSQLKEVKW